MTRPLADFGPDARRRASQWAFIFTRFCIADITRFSNLPTEDVSYVTIAVLRDGTDNCYLQGYVKTSRRCRVGMLQKFQK